MDSGAALATRVKTRVAEARTAFAAALDRGAGGRVATAVLSRELDEIVAELAGQLESGMVLLASGGWGRREALPGSDLDLLFLTAGEPDEAVRERASALLYPMWDAGLEVGHAVRGLGEALELAASDLATTTSLLDARPLVGDLDLAASLHSRLRGRFSSSAEVNAFLEALSAERAGRYGRFGDSMYLLEPNLKHGQGALRDVCLARWAGHVRWGAAELEELPSAGGATARQTQALTQARDFLLELRGRMHVAARRRQDQLTFELQEQLGPIMVGEGKAVGPAVEALMGRYYLHARAVARESERLIERAQVARRAPTVEPIVRQDGQGHFGADEVFLVWNGQLAVAEPWYLRERPAELVRAFRLAGERGLPISGRTLDAITDAVHADPAAVTGNPEAAAHFVAVLAQPGDARQPSLLEQMNDTGLLSALMPEWSACRGRVQHDLYHVFTVDEHQLLTVAFLKRILRGDHSTGFGLRPSPPASEADGAPLEKAVVDAAAQVERRLPLLLGALLHDVGKPLGKGHAEKGARLAQSVGKRLGLAAEDIHQAEFLVQKHLLLSHLSQRRDLDDVGMVAQLAGSLRDEETLRELFVLTYCDGAMTNPGNMSSWKTRLLVELYERTRAHFRRGPDLAGADRSELVARRRARVGALVGEPVGEGSPLAEWLGGLPDRVLATLEPHQVARLVALSRTRGERAATIDVAHHPRKGISELLLAARDAPGLLARVTGVLLASKVDIVAASVFSHRSGEALDVFLVRDRQGRAIAKDDPRWARLAQDLEAVVGGAVDVDALVARRRDKGGLFVKKTPAVATEIEIDNAVAEDFTVLDVYTQDRPGVLFAITHALSDLGLDIHLSKVASEANRVADVFYVRDPERGKVIDPAQLARIREALLAALAAVPA